MTELITEKWRIRGSFTRNGNRVTKSITVFAKGCCEARETAIQAWESKGYESIILHSEIQIAQ